MVTFELKSGSRSDFRPDASGKVIVPIKGRFLFPTKWLKHQINCGNVTIDDHDLFVTEVSKSKMLLIDILTNLNKYGEYDYVVMNSIPKDYEVLGYMIPNDRGVYPMLDAKQGFPVLETLLIANDGRQLSHGAYSTVYSYNKAMESYFINYGVVLEKFDPNQEEIDAFRHDTHDLSEGVSDWLTSDRERSGEPRREAILAKRREKVNKPKFMSSINEVQLKRSYF